MESRNLIFEMMDPILIRINEIKDIEEISLTDLVPTNRDSRINVIPNLSVIYDGGKSLILSSFDKYFDVFVKKVFQVYNLEKNRRIVDPDFDPFGLRTQIRIDDRTKQILETGDLTKVNEVYSFYDGKKSYERSLLYQSDQMRLLLPMIKYHLKQIFDCTNRTITFDSDNLSGYRINYSLKYKVDTLDDTLLITLVNFDNNEAQLIIRSRTKKFEPLKMGIRFNKSRILVLTSFDSYDLFCSNSYEVQRDNTIETIFTVHKTLRKEDGTEFTIPMRIKKGSLERVENKHPNISSIDSADDVIWYKLPWDAMYGVNNKIEVLSDVDEVVMTHNKYLALVGDEFMMKEYASREYQRRKTNDANANQVVLDEVNKRVSGVLLDNNSEGIYAIETYFAGDMRDNGYTDTYLKNRYFYHLQQSQEKLEGLNREGLIPVSKDDNVIIDADLSIVAPTIVAAARKNI